MGIKIKFLLIDCNKKNLLKHVCIFHAVELRKSTVLYENIKGIFPPKCLLFCFMGTKLKYHHAKGFFILNNFLKCMNALRIKRVL